MRAHPCSHVHADEALRRVVSGSCQKVAASCQCDKKVSLAKREAFSLPRRETLYGYYDGLGDVPTLQ
jgi:hypothetical protein